ncbi:endonuclease III [Deferribacter autotrophicus]|uniref:Endonuclease III n=1 Tax=Deferribacter autotrophicus TaxID=500465 RepID=A0A5A8F4N3_9BACT|nr:endonuclease III [Deferribacter autotrophicus]KAA0258354.1 endonuclease III [Deferribacter autotrophicus]
MINKKKIVEELIRFLDERYSDAKCSLDYVNPFQLLIATILSAQCTDERVNKVTCTLFKKYRSFEDFARADIEEFMEDIKPTGFYRNKAKNIKKLSEIVVEKYDGKMPEDIDELVKLPGIGRKTANVVLGNCFGKPGIVVDTHVKRISQRLGLTDNDNPDKIERDLMELIPEEKWTKWSHQMIEFGRDICSARKPKCESCPLSKYCGFYLDKKGVM